MKRFMQFSMIAAAILLVAVMASMFVAPVSAATDNVIYISDTGTGDGSSKDKPLKAEVRTELDTSIVYDHDDNADTEDACEHGVTAAEADQYYCLCFSSTGDKFNVNSVLYQAVEKLKNTGGTIVLVGDVKIGVENTSAYKRHSDRDMNLPTHGQNQITIKGDGGKLIIEEGSRLSLGGNTVFKDIEIQTTQHDFNGVYQGEDKNEPNYVDPNGNEAAKIGKDVLEEMSICACGYKTVFEESVTCTTDITDNVFKATARYLSLAGGKRYGDLKRDVDLTISGGTWNVLYGGNKGNNNNTHWGDINVTITGGTILSSIWGDSQETVLHCGNTYYHVTGGTFNDIFYAHSGTGVGYKGLSVYMKIDGGTFTSSTPFRSYNAVTLDATCITPHVTFDLSDYSGSSDLSNKVNTTRVPDVVYYPASMVSSVALKNAPSNALWFADEEYYAKNMVVSVTYSNGKTADVSYTPDDSKFVFSGDNSVAGKTTTVTGTYCGKSISGLSETVNVVDNPVPNVLGAQISTENVNGGLRFVAEMLRSAESYITLNDYGFYIWDSTVLDAEELESIEKLHGVDQLTVFGEKFRAEYDSHGIYNNDKRTMFAAVYDDIQVNDYGKSYIAVAYVEYSYNGETYTSYSVPVARSVIDVANLAVESGIENKSWITENVINRYNSYLDDIKDKTLANYDSAKSDELRKIVVDEMKENVYFAWTPSVDIDLTESVTVGGNTYTGYSYTAGTTYYGIPYIANAKSELGEFKSYVKTYKDGTNMYLGPIEGVNDFYSSSTDEKTLKQAEYVESNKYKVDEKYHEITSFFPGADFTGMIVNVWNKVGTNNVWLTGLRSFLPAYGRGTVAVGDYDYTTSSQYTNVITAAEGQEKMYAAYAQCKSGDVVLALEDEASGSGRSIYMVMEDAGDSSLRLVTFNPAIVDATDENGSNSGKSHFQWKTMSFADLYSGNFIPITIPELATGTQTQTTTVVTGFDGASVMKSGFVSGTVLSNKQIISVNVKLSRFNDDGEFYNETVYCNSVKDQNVNKFDLSYFDFSDVLTYLVDGKEYTLTVNVNVANEGVKKVVEYKYTEPTVDVSSMYSEYYNSFSVDFSNITNTPIANMKEQMDIYWTTDTTFTFEDLEGRKEDNPEAFVPNTKFTKDVIYRGILYSNTRATLADFAASLNSTPTYNSKLGKNVYTLSGVSNPTDWNYVMGNHCSSSMYHAYQLVTRLHASSRGNPNMELLGLKDLYYGVASYTNSVVKLYGAEAMYESYALANAGDFMYHNSTGGHTRMVQSVTVVRDSVTGRIDPDSSKILMIEQTDTLESEKDTSFISSHGYDTTWWEHEYTFRELSTKSIILRPHEFMTNETEKHYVGLTKSATKELLEKPSPYKMGIVESNYPIIAVRITITDTEGNVLDKVEKRALTSVNAYNIGQLFTTKTGETVNSVNDGRYLNNTEDGYICTSNYKGKSYTYTLEVELAAGKVAIQTLDVTAS